MSNRRLCSLLFAALIGAASFAASAADRPALRIAVQANSAGQEPVAEVSNPSMRNHFPIHETLVKPDIYGDFSLRPNLATSWEWISPTVLELKLRTDVVFHDGRTMTADDVVFSFGPERMTADGAPGNWVSKSYYSPIASVEAVNPSTVRFNLKAPDPIFLQRLSFIAAAIVSKGGWQDAGGNWENWAQKPIGAGPYKVQSYQAGDNVVLAAHDRYFGGKPNAETVTLKVVPEVSSRIAGLLAGDYDIVSDIPPDQLPAIEGRKGFSVVGGPIPNHRILFFDKNNPATKDPRIRQALIVSIDRQAIVDSIWGGRTVVPNGVQFASYGPLYAADRAAYKYDPKLARQLLKDAGYKGQQIELRSNNNYYTAEIPVSQAIVAMWQSVGINAKLSFIETGAGLFAESPNRVAGNWSSSALITDPYLGFWAQLRGTGTLGTRGIWASEAFDALGAQLDTASDPQARKTIYQRMMDIVEWEDPGVTVLHQNAVFFGKRDGVKWKPATAFYLDIGPQQLSFDPK